MNRFGRGATEDFVLLTAAADATHKGTPFGLLASALRTWAGLGANDSPEVQCEKLLAGIGRTLGPCDAPAMAEFLGEMLGCHVDDEARPVLHAARRDPQLMAERMRGAWLGWIKLVCQGGPVVFLVEDLHWSDSPSVHFLEAALCQESERPFLVLAFARPEVRDVFPNLWAERDLVEFRLPKLGAKSCERLLQAIATPALDPDQQASLVERAEGNPFFLEELVTTSAKWDTAWQPVGLSSRRARPQPYSPTIVKREDARLRRPITTRVRRWRRLMRAPSTTWCVAARALCAAALRASPWASYSPLWPRPWPIAATNCVPRPGHRQRARVCMPARQRGGERRRCSPSHTSTQVGRHKGR